MPNNLLTATAITREALRVLHQKLNFVGTITRDYDDRFAKQGAKIGDTLKVRMPNEFVVRTGPTLTAQDTVEQSVDVKITTQKGVDLNFTSVDLTLSLDDFSERIIEPAMSVLAANIEADAMSMYADVAQSIWNMGQAATFANILKGRKMLVDALAPLSGRTANLNTQDNVDLVDALKGLFNDSKTLSKQYREGYMGRTAGFDFLENTLWPMHTRGSANGGYKADTTGIASGADSIAVTGGTGSLKKGDVITIAGVKRVHPETKKPLTQDMQLVVTEDYAGGSGTIKFAPALITSGGRQNCVIAGNASAAITVAGSEGVTGTSLLYQKGAFAFATADLVMPRGVDFAAREAKDGISMRIVRQYDINNDKFPCRLDVLYGYKTLRPQLAVRVHNN